MTTIGVQLPSSDPYIESFPGDDIESLLPSVMPIIERARASWSDAPKYPDHKKPPVQTNRQTPRPRRPNRPDEEAPAKENEREQPKLF